MMARLLKAAAVLLVSVALGVGAVLVIRSRHGKGTAAGSATTVPTATTATTALVVPGPAQSFVTGTLTSLVADKALGPALRPPFTITIPTRGQGHADITGVTAAGKAVQVFWYGGQPLPVSGSGTLALDGAPVSIDASGITWMLDGAPRSLTTGHFNLGAPVAAGASGLAAPHDSYAFDAGDRSTIETTGQARVHVAPVTMHLGGPGKVTMHGALQLRSLAGTSKVRTVIFGTGSYTIDLVPAAGGYTITSVLQGPVSFG